MAGTDASPARTVTLSDLVRVVVHLRWYWLGGAIAGLVLGVAAGLLMTPVYRATVVVMPTAGAGIGKSAVAGLLSRFGDFGLGSSDGAERDEALAVLRSRQFVQDFIADEKLMPVLFADQWDAKASAWRAADPARVPTMWDGWLRFDREVRTILEDRDRGLVTIRVEWRDPELAASWANGMVARANAQLRQRKLQQIKASLDFLEAELAKTSLVELRSAISDVMEAQINDRMLAMSRPEYAFRVVDPAVPPDTDQPEQPKKLLLAALGLAAGGIIGFMAGLLRAYRRADTVPAPARHPN